MKRGNFPRRKDEKRKAAQERNAAWKKLSTEEKIRRLKQRPGNCKKQLEKLQKQ